MAKFKNSGLYLKTDQKIVLGTSEDVSFYYDGSDLSVTSTISGVYPTQSYHLTTKDYVDSVASASDHGLLNGLLDDDHPQYVPVDGSRGFTSTVSGVSPVYTYDLATKGYVDNQTSDKIKTGRLSLALNDYTKSVTFTQSFLDTNYTISTTLVNTVDSPPSIYSMMVSAKSSSGFTVLFSGDMDSSNYVLEWSAIHD